MAFLHVPPPSLSGPLDAGPGGKSSGGGAGGEAPGARFDFSISKVLRIDFRDTLTSSSHQKLQQ